MRSLLSHFTVRGPPTTAPPTFPSPTISRLGLPAPITALAHDPAQGLLALGLSDSSVLVCSAHFESLLTPPPLSGHSGPRHVKLLVFVERFIVACTGDDTVY